MDTISVNYLITAKTEYEKQLISQLTPNILKVFKKLYNNAELICNDETTPENILMVFQYNLEKISKWNASTINKYYKNFIKDSGCSLFSDLMKIIFITHIKILTLMGHNKKELNIDIPSPGKFLHLIYLECARNIWQMPFLFYNIKSNLTEIKNIFEKSIISVIQSTIPIDNIISSTDIDKFNIKDENRKVKDDLKKITSTLLPLPHSDNNDIDKTFDNTIKNNTDNVEENNTDNVEENNTDNVEENNTDIRNDNIQDNKNESITSKNLESDNKIGNMDEVNKKNQKKVSFSEGSNVIINEKRHTLKNKLNLSKQEDNVEFHKNEIKEIYLTPVYEPFKLNEVKIENFRNANNKTIKENKTPSTPIKSVKSSSTNIPKIITSEDGNIIKKNDPLSKNKNNNDGNDDMEEDNEHFFFKPKFMKGGIKVNTNSNNSVVNDENNNNLANNNVVDNDSGNNKVINEKLNDNDNDNSNDDNDNDNEMNNVVQANDIVKSDTEIELNNSSKDVDSSITLSDLIPNIDEINLDAIEKSYPRKKSKLIGATKFSFFKDSPVT